MRKAYLVCPECKTATEFTDVIEARITLRAYPCEADVCYEETDLQEDEHIYCECSNCGALYRNYRAEDFAVVVEAGEIVSVGDFWENKVEELKKILKPL